MAWGIKFDGTSSSDVSINTTLSAGGADGTAQDWVIEFRWSVESGDEGSYQRPLGLNGSTSERIYLSPTNKQVVLVHSSSAVTWTLSSFPLDGVFKLVKAAGSNNVELFVDTVSQGIKTQSTPGVCEIEVFGRNFTYYTKGTLHWFAYTDNISSANSIDFAIEEGGGTTITDSINGYIGTLGTTTAWVSEGSGLTLTISDASHGHVADNISLSLPGALTVADALHSHAADNLDLTQANVITIAEATHAHSADNITLSAVGVITLPAMKNNTGTVNASDTGITVDVYSIATGALVERFTGEITDASGVCSVFSSNLTPGTSYVVVVRRSTDAIGLAEVAAS